MSRLVSIIIPTYNEALRIGETLKAIAYYCDTNQLRIEVIVVDDGSEDETVVVVESYRQLFQNFKIIENKINRGKGYSVRQGMMSAVGDLRLFMDADQSVKIHNLRRFMEEIDKGADIAIASIELPGSTVRDDNHGYRRVLGALSKRFIRLLATPRVYDTQRGFKLFSKKASNLIFPRITIERWGFDIEVIVIAEQHGLIVRELAVDWINSKASSVGIGSYPRTLLELVHICIDKWLGRYKI